MACSDKPVRQLYVIDWVDTCEASDLAGSK